MTASSATRKDIRYAGPARRLMAIIYDLILLIAILFVVTFIANALNRGESITPGSVYHVIYVLTLLAISFFYYGWFWTHGGQTLGMKTWKIKLLSATEGPSISWKLSAIRFVVAQLSWICVGLGFLWSLFNKQNKTWHDIASNSVLIDLR